MLTASYAHAVMELVNLVHRVEACNCQFRRVVAFDDRNTFNWVGRFHLSGYLFWKLRNYLEDHLFPRVVRGYDSLLRLLVEYSDDVVDLLPK